MVNLSSSQATSLSEFIASTHQDSVAISSFSCANYFYSCDYSMDSICDLIMNPDGQDSNPFMFQLSSSTFLSQASSPSPIDHVRVELIGQPDEFPPFSGNSALFEEFNDVNLTPAFSVEDEGDDTSENAKENISAHGLLMTCLNQLSKDGDFRRSQSLSLSQRSQNQNSQRSQDNIFQLKSLDNSKNQSFDNFSQPQAFSSSYGSSHGSIGGFNESQNLPASQPSTSQEGSCCKKHLKYFQKPAKSGKKQIIEDCIIDIHALYSSTHNGYLKPPFSHNMLCALAICSVPTRQQEVSEVYRFLMACFPYFKIAGQHWKNSLRHSLATCDWFAKSDSPRTAKKGYKYTIRLSKKNCLKCEIKKQCVFDLTKLHYRLSGPTVCEFLINMGLISLSHEKLAELRQKNREFYTSFPDGIKIENPEE
ncbi:uncharacterized protein LOC107362655 [Tetranychus urticae]|uniref:Fork-head domain-containing protein n=1 Tax=Tetranychus urticae TaxID=32264 RepID=T1KAP8_TETUR|nr:uncharacterized protein LOC107362655 [Tetranychus urticae]